MMIGTAGLQLASRELLMLEVACQIEQLRTRGGSFSTAILRFEEDGHLYCPLNEAAGPLRDFLRRVDSCLRETDVLAFLDPETLAVMTTGGVLRCRQTEHRIRAVLGRMPLQGQDRGALKVQWRSHSWTEPNASARDVLAFLRP